MGFRFLIFIAYCWLAARMTLSAGVAVILTDVKMDDKGAFAVALLKRDIEHPNKPQYERIIAVITGVQDRVKVGFALEEYLRRAEKHQPSIPTDWRDRLVILKAHNNIMARPAPHEAWYKELKPTKDYPVATGARIQAEVAKVKDPYVDMFQIAPTEDSSVYEFIQHLPDLRFVHLFLGYNSKQGAPHYFDSDGKPITMNQEEKLALGARQVQFHASLSKHVTARNPKARFIWTQSEITFKFIKANSQELEWCEHYFPEWDVAKAVRDPYWTRIICDCREFANQKWKITEEDVPGINNGREMSDNPSTQFMEKVLEARKTVTPFRYKIYRQALSCIANKDFPHENKRSFDRANRDLLSEFQFIKKGEKPHPSLEMGDATHIATVMMYGDQEKTKQKGELRLVHAESAMEAEDPENPPKVTVSDRDIGHGWILEGAKYSEVRDYVANLFNHHHSTAGSGHTAAGSSELTTAEYEHGDDGSSELTTAESKHAAAGSSKQTTAEYEHDDDGSSELTTAESKHAAAGSSKQTTAESKHTAAGSSEQTTAEYEHGDAEIE